VSQPAALATSVLRHALRHRRRAAQV